VGPVVALGHAHAGCEVGGHVVVVLVEVLAGDRLEAGGAEHDADLAHQQGVGGEGADQLLAQDLAGGLDRPLLGRPGAEPEGEVVVLAVGVALATHDHVDLRVVVAEERARGDVGGLGDLVDGGGVVALALEEVDGGGGDRVAGARLLAFPQAARLVHPSHHAFSPRPSVTNVMG
jgi:hypothetical protein